MSYKTILVHLTDTSRVAELIDVSCRIGERFGAHITALYVMPHLAAFGAPGLGVELIEAGERALREEADRVRAAYDEAIRGRSVVPEFRLFEPGGVGVAECVLEQARTADLVVASQRSSTFNFGRQLDFPERLALESGRPVLIVPSVGHFGSIGKRISVAWNLRREASRAVFDALPLLQAADRVRITWVNPQKERYIAGDLPGAEIGATLARHGVKCTTATAVGDEISVGDIILSGLTDDEADLLVMGAWGHSRLREMVFGGVTRHILEHMTVPVLLSH